MFQKLSIRNFSFKNVKNLILSGVFVLAGFLIFLPDLCFASSIINIYPHFFEKIPIILCIFLFFAIWIIESNVIKTELKESPRRALSVSLVINSIATFLGYLFYTFDVFDFFHLSDYNFLIFPILLFVVELIILFFSCRKAQLGNLFKTAFIMNLASCSFILFFTFFCVASTVLAFLIFLVSMYYFSLCLLKSLKNDEKNLERKQKKIAILIGVFSFIFLIFFYIVAIKLEYVDTMRGSRRKAIEAQVQSDIRNIGVAMEFQYIDDNNDKYIQSSILPESIGQYMKEVHSPPHKDYTYVWVDNTGEGQDQYFCVYAKLKFHSPDIWYVASEKGIKEMTREPTGLGDACW